MRRESLVSTGTIVIGAPFATSDIALFSAELDIRVDGLVITLALADKTPIFEPSEARTPEARKASLSESTIHTVDSSKLWRRDSTVFKSSKLGRREPMVAEANEERGVVINGDCFIGSEIVGGSVGVALPGATLLGVAGSEVVDFFHGSG